MRIEPILESWGSVVTTHYSNIFAQPSFWRSLLYQRKVLVFKGFEGLSPSILLDLHKAFGTPWKTDHYRLSKERVMIIDDTTLTFYGGLTSKHRIGHDAMPWHRDIPWHRSIRYPIRSLYPIKLENVQSPTMFCDASVLYDRLSASEVEELEQLELEICNWYQVTDNVPEPDLQRIPLVEVHPVSGRSAPLLNSFIKQKPEHTYGAVPRGAWIRGLYKDGVDVGLDLMQRYHELVCTDDNIYSHDWSLGDLVFFDNWSGVFHRRPPLIPIDAESAMGRDFYRLNLYHPGQPEL